jgi:diguanylate cyclase (GGDEF)-like protein/PAS domain S-box-containing protein
MTITDLDANIIKVNQAFTEITGYSADEVIGKNPRVLQSSQHDKHFYQQMWEALKNEGRWKGEIYNQRKNGEIYPEILSITAIKDEHNITTHYIAQFLDISHIKNAQKEAEHKAQHDVLTGIANRAKLLEETEQAFDNGRRTQMQHLFMFLDIDNFKQVNDFYGHKVGDAILVEIAARLKSCIRAGDLVSRLGGDEFFIICPDTDEEGAMNIANIVHAKISQLTGKVADGVWHGSISIGVAVKTDSMKNLEELIKAADLGVYAAKSAGKNCVRIV